MITTGCKYRPPKQIKQRQLYSVEPRLPIPALEKVEEDFRGLLA